MCWLVIPDWSLVHNVHRLYFFTINKILGYTAVVIFEYTYVFEKKTSYCEKRGRKQIKSNDKDNEHKQDITEWVREVEAD